ncbi:Structural maintenance of chromosomes protein 6 [Orbilia javanica]|uniref:Structural maintenance of chromosomes protein 6 n=1 Tax=Orbilia javanica TaxID=47235 RepID=A0AAN8NS28_9PEZI
MSAKRPRSKTKLELALEQPGAEGDAIQSNKKLKTMELSANIEEDSADMDSDEEALYFEQSQLIAASSTAPRGNEPADYGTIELIRLENFMCHPCLEMKFGPFMNFVVGQNGSGKSAVLTALTLCLGAKAAVTNRGGNVKSFIKEGEHMAVVEVHLRNRGDGFKKDIYGDTIIVQRTFNRDGITAYKIKAKSGKVISTTKKELSDIIDYMSLQVDNPMTVLSQDLARQFLSNSTDEDKYKFFMKGVQLDDLYALYQALKSQQALIDGVLESKAEDIRELKEDKDAAEKKFRLLQQTEDLRKNVNKLLLRHAWAQVSESRSFAEAAKNKLSDSEGIKQDLNKKLEDARAAVDTWEQKVSQASAAVKSSSASIDPLKDEKKESEDSLKNNNEKLKKIQGDERSVHGLMTGAQQKLERAQRDVDAEKQRLADADDGKLASLVEEKVRLLERKERFGLEVREIDEHTQTEQSATKDNKPKLSESQEKVKEREAGLRDAQNSLRQLTTNQSGNLEVYGPNISRLLNAIDRIPWKAGKPIGPIGLSVKLKDGKWSSILERQLSRTLTGFIALSPDDKERLISLTREHRCSNPVYYTSRTSFQLKEPPLEHLTVLRAIKIENEEVQKLLVMMNQIEQTILVEDHVEARRVMETSPKNVKLCYSINKNKRGNGFNIKMGQGSGGVEPIIGWDKPPRMATSVEEQIMFAETKVSQKTSELDEARNRYAELKAADDTSQRNLMELKNRKQRNKTEIMRIEDQIDVITNTLEQDNSNKELNRLEGIAKGHEETYQTYATQHEDTLTERQRLLGIQTELKRKIGDIDDKIGGFEKHADGLQSLHTAAIQQKEKSVLASSEAIQKIERQDAIILELADAAEKAEEHVRDQIAEAQKVGAEVRLGPNDTTQKIEARLNQLEADIRKKDARIGASSEKIAKDCREKTEKYNAAREEVADLERVHQALQQAFEERMERWGYFRKYISVQSRYQFRFLMSEREFDGKLAFDHKRGVLQLKVQPSQQATDTQRNTKTLSGGEKSFSQICLLLALWEAMGSPFRCLDEFDVFMDAVNRGVSMGLIIKAARNSVGKQFILITPQDVSTKGIDETADVRIVRMPDPQRNQTRLQVRR